MNKERKRDANAWERIKERRYETQIDGQINLVVSSREIKGKIEVDVDRQRWVEQRGVDL